ncbi:hypothetical protein BGX31_003694 [Mortierella sp. GBA43]|nr:hypothetical protein BGX31_003694 [Mortierella sp. GBA43]
MSASGLTSTFVGVLATTTSYLLPSDSDMPTATISSIITSATATATTTALAAATATPSPSPMIQVGVIGKDPNMLCDWIRSATDCRDADFIRSLLITSTIMHGLTFMFAIWLLIYRNRGLNSKIVTELFTKVGNGVRPKPMDCITFFSGAASLCKIAANLPVILDVWKDKLWLRIVFEQFYWIIVAIGFSSYFVGLLYAMPVTTRQGIFAIYHPETAYHSRPLPPIHVLTPTVGMKNFLLVMGAVYPAIGGFGAGVASAVYAQKPGYENLSSVLHTVQYVNWVIILWAMAIMFFYYGLKYTFILRANIVIAEAALKAPRAAFGIGNLRSSSPARFLFIQLQITGFGGAAATLLAGSLCMIWVLRRQQLLSMEHPEIPHMIAWWWTCAMTVCFGVMTGLIAAQSVRNRRRGLHDPASSSSMPSSGGQKSSNVTKSQVFSTSNQKGRPSTSESEARQALRHSDLSTLHSINSVDNKDTYSGHIALEMQGEPYDETAAVAAIVEATRRMDQDAFNTSHNANKLEQERALKNPVGSPSRPFIIKSHSLQQNEATNSTFDRRGSEAPLVQGRPQDLRQTVFGRATSPPPRPTSPTASCPSSPGFPMTALRSTSRNSGSKYGTTSQASYGSSSPPSHTTSFSSNTLTSGTRESKEIPLPTHSEQIDPPFGTGKGLSPPPRTKRLASTTPKEPTAPASPVRGTFLTSAPGTITGSYLGSSAWLDEEY